MREGGRCSSGESRTELSSSNRGKEEKGQTKRQRGRVYKELASTSAPTSASAYARLLYASLCSAVPLHLFLARFRPLDSPVVLTLPLPELVHDALSLGCLVLAFCVLVLEERTWTLMGLRRALAVTGGGRSAGLGAAVDGGDGSKGKQRVSGRGGGRRSTCCLVVHTSCEKRLSAHPTSKQTRVLLGMDIITWQALVVHNAGGALAFVLFSGLSILPRSLTFSDLIVRAAAALYLRIRSKAFRRWVERVETAHIFTWALRVLLLVVALRQRSAWESAAVLAAGAVVVALLRLAETGLGGWLV